MGAANKLYNGNIAETFWSTATDGGFVRNYGYKYDNLNRLKDATYQKSGQLTNMYNENLSYDKNGNIMNLSRYGDRDEQYLPIQIDNLGYGYATNSNKLMSVVDNSNNTSGFKDGNTTGDDYVYDANGNMTVDKNKNITGIVYNHLNLPTKIIFPTGNIVYFYTASGQKVQKVVTENATVTTTDYLGGYQYQNMVLQFFPTVEGYVKNTPVSGTNSYSYVFNYTDHLGNTRLSYAKDTTTGSLKILEENNYYPFGLKHNSYNVDNFQPGYKYKFNGKELQDELSLNLYDYGARNYDPALGRWMNIDPLAETSRRFSPYVYALNNPVVFIDPDGMEAKGADGLTNSEWLTANRRSDSPTAQLDAEQKEFDNKQAEIDYFANKNKKKKNVIVGNTEVIDSGLNHVMHSGDGGDQEDPPTKQRTQESDKAEGWTNSQFRDLYGFNELAIEAYAYVRGAAELSAVKWGGFTTGLKGLFSAETKILVQFGKGQNQVSHAFRHVEAMGLSKDVVKSAIMKDIPRIAKNLPYGKSINTTIKVSNQQIIYSSYKLPNGTINIGRITGLTK
jgi:RHS repeat-associated protein